MIVKIYHPPVAGIDQTQTVLAEPTDTPQQYVLRGHVFLYPLGPGDVVEVDNDMIVRRVVKLCPQYIFEVSLHLPMDFLAGPSAASPGARTADKLQREWESTPGVHVTAMHTYAYHLSCSSLSWFNENVRSSKYVEHVEPLRIPTTDTVSLEVPL